jgi:hypothetical protein
LWPIFKVALPSFERVPELIMAAPSNTTGIADMHPTIGLQLEVRAAFFGEDWAKEKFGDDWESARLEGVVRDSKGGRPPRLISGRCNLPLTTVSIGGREAKWWRWGSLPG